MSNYLAGVIAATTGAETIGGQITNVAVAKAIPDGVTFEDGTLTFEVARDFEGQSFTQTFTATVEEDELTGTVDGGPGGNQDFTATRSTE